MDIEENKDVVRRFVREFPARSGEALAANDPAPLASQFTDDCVWVMPNTVPRGGEHRGMPALLDFLRDGIHLFEPGTMKTELVSMIAEGDYVAARVHCTGISSKHRPYDNQYHVLFRIRDGKVSEFWDYQDTLHLVQTCYAD